MGKSKVEDFLLVGIGASAGGIKALKEFFSRMPADPGMAFVVILHLSQAHKSNLAEIIQRETRMAVEQVSETVKVEPNKVYVIPPAKHLELVDGVIRLREPERVKGVRVPIDRFFRTLADAYGRRAVCIILSGTGSDGTIGLKHVKGKDGFAIVQDPADAEYDGMPRSAIETRIADVVLPVAEMPGKLLFVRDTTEKFRLTDGQDGAVAKEIKNIETLRDVLTLLRVRTGHDFSNYKRPTLIRRVARHLQIHETDDLEVYLQILREKPDEVLSLLKNLLINVTNFFRDKESFAALEEKVIPNLFEGKTSGEQVRVWIAGCSTGEEAYSVAILLSEYAATLPDPPKIQIFASDVGDDAIAEAREGRFTEAVVSDVPPERLQRHFVKEEDGYRIRKQIREMILFAPHNILRDPPFSRIDLISCRNVLIYLNRETQQKVLQVFHFALREGGFLFLGSSESAEAAANNFSPVDKKHRIYRCRPSSAAWNAPPTMPLAGAWTPKISDAAAKTRNHLQSFGELHHRLIEQYAPPSVLVNEEGDILHLSENAGRFLRFVGGVPSANLLKVIHPALLPDARAALFAARKENKTIGAKNIRVEFDGEERFVNLIVRPALSEPPALVGVFPGEIHPPATAGGSDKAEPPALLLVIFEEIADAPQSAESVQAIVAGDKAMESVVRRMEDALRHTKNQLRSTIEQYETSTEELKASNEELQAINEELRSASEELETSKEELQSVNEELTTVNQELKEKFDQVNHVNSDLQNLVQSTNIATIFLDRDLRIKRYTPRATEIFNLIPADVGRPLAHITHRLEPDDFAADAALSLKNLHTFEREVRSTDNDRFFIARFSPYRTHEDKIEGVVISFIDVTEREEAENLVREERAYAEAIVETVREPLVVLDKDLRVVSASRSFYETFKVEAGETVEKFIYDLGDRQWDIPALRELLEDILPQESKFQDFEVEHDFEAIGRRTMLLNARKIRRDDECRRLILLAIADITERKQVLADLRASEDNARASEDKYRTLFNSIDEGFCTIEVLFDENDRPFDYRFLDVSPSFERQTGIKDAVGKRMREIAPRHEEHWFEIYGRIALTGESLRFENRAVQLHRWYDVYAFRVGVPAERKVGVLFNDITERKRRERNLAFLVEVTDDLTRLTKVDETMDALGEKIGRFFDAKQCLFAEHADEFETSIVSYGWNAEDAPGLKGTYRTRDFLSDELMGALMTGEPIVVSETRADKRVSAESYGALGIRSFIIIPLAREREWRFQISVIDDKPREWRDDEVDLMRELAARIWARLERARAEEALRESEERFRNMADHAPVMVWMTGPDARCSYLSQSWYEFTGQTPETGLGFGWLDATHPNDKEESERIFLAANERREAFRLEYRLRRKDGEYRWAIDSAQPRFAETGEFLGYIGSVIDITERKRAEEAVRESEERLRALVENLPGGAVFVLDREMRYLIAEGEALTTAGFTPQDLVGRTIREALPPELAAEYEPKFRRALAGEPYEYEHDAHDRSFISRGLPLAGADGEPAAVLAISYDITDRKRAEERLRQSEESYRAIVNQAVAGIFKLDLDGHIIFVNDRVGEMLGYTSEEMLRLTMADIVYERDAGRNEQLFERLKTEGRAFEIEKRLVRKDGSLVWVNNQVSPIHNGEGRPRQVTVVSVDITARKVVETLLDAQKRALEMVVGGSPLLSVLAYLARIIEQQSDGSSVVSIMLLDGEGRMHNGASPSLPEDLLRAIDGIPADENVGTCSRTAATGAVTVTPDIARDPRWKKLKHLPLKHGLRAAWSMPILDSAGRVLGTIGTYFREKREPTPFEMRTVEILTRTAALAIERQRAEDEFRESQKFVQGIVTSAPMAFYIFDLTEQKNVYLSPQVFEMFGHTPEEMRAKGSDVLPAFFHPEDLPHIAKHFDRIRQSGENEIFEIEYRLRHANGEWRWVKSREVIHRRDGEGVPTQILGAVEDVTHRKRAEEALRESETRFRATFEQANVGIVQLSADGKFLLVNPGFCQIVGYSEEECRNMTVRDLTHPEDYEAEETETRRLMAGEISGYTLEKRYIHKNGAVVWGTMTAALVRTEAGEPFYLLAIVEDISERKRAEETLRKSEERFRLLVESAKDYAIFTLDLERRVESWNPGAEAIFGYAEAEIIGRSGDILFTPEDRERGVPEEEARAALTHGRASDERWHSRKDGSRFFASGVMRPLGEGASRGLVKIARDLTDHRRAEEELRRSHDELEERVAERTVELLDMNVNLQTEVTERRKAERERAAIMRRLVMAQEDERRRIARDMHDQFGQQLTALLLKLGMLKEACGDRTALCAEVESLEGIARQLDADVDFLVWELRPTALDDLGLEAAVANYAENWSKHFGVPVELQTTGFKGDRLTSETETVLYRILQEALNNVAKHAQAGGVNIVLDRRADTVSLIVEDDGVGFDDGNISGAGDHGLGLAGMRERAALVGGTVVIETHPGDGTSVIVRIPSTPPASGK